VKEIAQINLKICEFRSFFSCSNHNFPIVINRIDRICVGERNQHQLIRSLPAFTSKLFDHTVMMKRVVQLLLLCSLLPVLVFGDQDGACSQKRELQDNELCRCEASCEHFYSRWAPRNSMSSYDYRYDYTTAYLDTNGYYIIEGVRVLPSDNGTCSGNRNL
jgi:hypothetical protein